MDILNEAMQIANDKTFVRDLINSKNYSSLDKKRAQDMNILLANTQNDIRKSLNENTVTADIAQFTPILMPMVRRIFPNLIANELLGVQPMSMPTGYIYALTNQYIGDGEHYVGDRTTPAGVIYELNDDAADAGVVAGTTSVGDGIALYIEDNKVLASFTSTKVAVGEQIGTAKVVGDRKSVV